MREKRILGMLIALLVCLTTMAQGISMKFNRESLSSVLKKIERTTDYKFVFAYNDVSNYTVTGELKKASIDEAMAYLLADKPLGYTVSGKSPLTFEYTVRPNRHLLLVFTSSITK